MQWPCHSRSVVCGSSSTVVCSSAGVHRPVRLTTRSLFRPAAYTRSNVSWLTTRCFLLPPCEPYNVACRSSSSRLPDFYALFGPLACLGCRPIRPARARVLLRHVHLPCILPSVIQSAQSVATPASVFWALLHSVCTPALYRSASPAPPVSRQTCPVSPHACPVQTDLHARPISPHPLTRPPHTWGGFTETLGPNPGGLHTAVRVRAGASALCMPWGGSSMLFLHERLNWLCCVVPHTRDGAHALKAFFRVLKRHME